MAQAIVSMCLVMLSDLDLDSTSGCSMVNDINLRRADNGAHLNVDARGYSCCITCNACIAFSAFLLHFRVDWAGGTVIDLVDPVMVI